MDKTFEFTSKCYKSHNQRTMTDLKGAFYFAVIMFIIISLRGYITTAITMTVLFLIIQYISEKIFCRYHITYIKLSNNIIEINYYDKDVEKKIQGLISDFIIKKKRLQFKIPDTAYILIKFEGNTLLKQHTNFDWNEDTMDKLMKAIDPNYHKNKWLLWRKNSK